MTTADLLESIRAHLADFELPELRSAYVTTSFSGPNMTAQLACHTPSQIGSALLTWAATLTDVTAEAWRVPRGDRVHLSVTGRLPTGTPIQVYAPMALAEHGIGADLAPGARTTMPLAALRAPLTPRQATTP
jgi:hypothetical protein